MLCRLYDSASTSRDLGHPHDDIQKLTQGQHCSVYNGSDLKVLPTEIWRFTMKCQQLFCMKAMFCCIPESFQMQMADFGWDVMWSAASNCSPNFQIKPHSHKDPIFLLSNVLYEQPMTSCNVYFMYHKTLPTWVFDVVYFVYLSSTAISMHLWTRPDSNPQQLGSKCCEHSGNCQQSHHHAVAYISKTKWHNSFF